MLRLGAIRGAGVRAYVLVRGGLDCPPVMGSRSTFAAAGLGGRPLRKGDTLAIGTSATPGPPPEPVAPPPMTNAWTLRVVPGPHGAPDFLSGTGVAELFAAEWTVFPDL